MKRIKLLSVCFFILTISLSAQQNKGERREGNKTDPAINPVYEYYEWPNVLPDSCPFERSETIKGIGFTGRYANYTGADTWYLQWAPDGNQYSCWTDGDMDDFSVNSGIRSISTGQAKIEGNDPLNLKFVNLGRIYTDSNYYPCVSLIVNNVFYIGTYSAYNDTGYFAGFRYSKDWEHYTDNTEKNWEDPYWKDATASDNNFFKEKGKAKFRVPHTVIFGKNNEFSPDSKVYFSSHGYSSGSGKNNWNEGDAIYLCRVDPDIKDITNPKSFEFFGGYDTKGEPVWAKNVSESKPILDWPNHLGSESITYIKSLNKYILMTCRLKGKTGLPYNLFIIWESSKITGPYKIVQSLKDWGPQTYFPTIPAKFISDDGKSCWLVVASNFSSEKYNPFQCRYAASIHEIVFKFKDNYSFIPPALGKNIAREAKVIATSSDPKSPPQGATDGFINEASDNQEHEWVSQEGEGAYIKLSWDIPKTIDKVRLYDRPSPDNWIKEGYLTFSDGSTEYINVPLSNKAIKPTEINFKPKTVTWVKFTITKGEGELTQTTRTEPGKCLGLSEIEVYEVTNK